VTGRIRLALANRVARLRQPAPHPSGRDNCRHMHGERRNSDRQSEEKNRTHYQWQSQAGIADEPGCG